MDEINLTLFLSAIEPANKTIYEQARARLDSLVKPPGSLGELETIAARLAAVSGKLHPSVQKRAVVVFASDNGVVEEGVAAAPQQVTHTQTLNFIRGVTGVAVLAECFNADLVVVDVGVNADIDHPKIINRKVRKSTGNIAKTAAMDGGELMSAIQAGIDIAKDLRDAGYGAVGAGEMGIGNTTTSSAVLCALLGYKTEDEIVQTVGKGAGLTEEGFINKISVIKKALDLHKPYGKGPLEALRTVGGFDLAAMAGLYIGAACYKLPVVIDGFISAVAALCAVRLEPKCAEYMFASHHSYERGYALAIGELGMEAPLKLNMRLGEGSGCPLMFALMDAACAVIENMATFEEASVSGEYLDNIKNMESFQV